MNYIFFKLLHTTENKIKVLFNQYKYVFRIEGNCYKYLNILNVLHRQLNFGRQKRCFFEDRIDISARELCRFIKFYLQVITLPFPKWT